MQGTTHNKSIAAAGEIRTDILSTVKGIFVHPAGRPAQSQELNGIMGL